ncbi:MAG: aminotransferase class V-fold PLP-dependent enzyme [Deltaproteobacteria bacterium]|nr:aminotransferase class V-fold PLP-dependent enzyme [Deltaproteobacteria bacterium]
MQVQSQSVYSFLRAAAPAMNSPVLQRWGAVFQHHNVGGISVAAMNRIVSENLVPVGIDLSAGLASLPEQLGQPPMADVGTYEVDLRDTTVAMGVGETITTLSTPSLGGDPEVTIDDSLPDALSAFGHGGNIVVYDSKESVDVAEIIPLNTTGNEREFLEAIDRFDSEKTLMEQEVIQSLRAVLVYRNDQGIADATIDTDRVGDIIPVLERYLDGAGADEKALRAVLEEAIVKCQGFSSQGDVDLAKLGIIPSRSLTESLDLRRARKFFADPSGRDTQTSLALGDEASRVIANYLGDGDAPVFSGITGGTLATMFGSTEPPSEPEAISSVMRRFASDVVTHNMHLPDPRYMGHMLTYAPTLAIYGDAFTSMLNPNQIAFEVGPATTYAEFQVIEWLCSLIGFPRGTTSADGGKAHKIVPGGTLTAGGTIANMSALIVARNRALNDFFAKLQIESRKLDGNHGALLNSPYAEVRMNFSTLDITNLGLWGAIRPFLELSGYQDFRYIFETQFVILTSAEAHYSMKKIGGYIGIGADNVIPIPVDGNQKMNPRALEDKIRELGKGKKTVVIAVVGTAGTTASGNYDPISEIADICNRYKIWFHVDAAFGGGALLSEKHRHLLAGAERADSMTIDPHKWFFMPYALGACLFRDRSMLQHYLKSSAPYVIHADASDDEPNLGGQSIQGSMRAAGLKLWLAWQAMGTKQLGRIVDHNVAMTKYLESEVKRDPDLEPMHTAEIDLLLFRYLPRKLKGILLQAIEKGDYKTISAINRAVNDMNIEVQSELQASGRGWLSREEMEHNPYAQYAPTSDELKESGVRKKQSRTRILKGFNLEILRACIMNPHTEKGHVDTVLKEVLAMGDASYQRWLTKTRLFDHLEGYEV